MIGRTNSCSGGGSGELHGATISCTTYEETLLGTVATLSLNDEVVQSVTINADGTFSYTDIEVAGTYSIYVTNGTRINNIEVEITAEHIVNKTVISMDISFTKIVTFADGTDEEITAMLDAHYNGLIDVADYWSVGDKRLIHINAMSATGVSESHHADDYEFVIIGINHDNMTAGGKAAITLQTNRILYKNMTDTTYSSSYPAAADEGGYMNASNTNSGGWTNCARRTWCNNVFFNALPGWVQALVKPVNKLTSAGSQSSTINTTSDKVFLPSEIEIFGTTSYSYSGEGTQYDYFKTTTNRYKKPAYSGYSSAIWWERSPRSSNWTDFCVVNVNGDANFSIASGCRGLAPVFCM